MIGGPGQDTFEVQPGEGHSIVMDFTDGMDQIVVINSGSMEIRAVGNATELLSGGDLIATVLSSSGVLQQNGSILF